MRDYRKQFDSEQPAPQEFWQDAFVEWLCNRLDAAEDLIAKLRRSNDPTSMSKEEEEFWDKAERQ